MEDTEAKNDSGRFSRNLRLLLTHAYEVPEYREHFRENLLLKLKSRQKGIQLAERSFAVRPYFLGAFSGAAAAALLALVTLPTLLNHFNQTANSSGAVPATNRPESAVAFDNTTPSGRNSLGVVNPRRDDMLAEASETTRPGPRDLGGPEDDGPAPGRMRPPPPFMHDNFSNRSRTGDAMSVSTGRGAGFDRGESEPETAARYEELPTVIKAMPAELPDITRQEAVSYDSIGCLEPGGAGWKQLPGGSSLALAEGARLKSGEGESEPSGIWFTDGSKVIMHRNALVSVRGKGLELNGGSILAKTDAQGAGLCLRVAGRDLYLAPGGELFLHLENAGDYAEGGAPAPKAIVLSGEAIVAGSNQALQAGAIYELYDTLTGVLPGRPVGSIEKQRAEEKLSVPEARAKAFILGTEQCNAVLADNPRLRHFVEMVLQRRERVVLNVGGELYVFCRPGIDLEDK